jgi:formylglycine-generating enzyme required for sulfatase activity
VVRGPALVSVGNYFIHATEVTVSQYGAFLTAKNGDVSGQSEVCSWNQSYWDYDQRPIMEPGNQPIAYVDWCDAAAYCSWAGMRLCGKINGGPIGRSEVFDPTLSQWYVACGGPGGGTDPNDSPMCNSSQGFSDIAEVATFPGCQGYFPGLFDMAGNVSEWVDGCDSTTGPADVCYQMGGNVFDQKSYCDEIYNDAEEAFRRDEKAVASGFRCCSG